MVLISKGLSSELSSGCVSLDVCVCVCVIQDPLSARKGDPVKPVLASEVKAKPSVRRLPTEASAGLVFNKSPELRTCAVFMKLKL